MCVDKWQEDAETKEIAKLQHQCSDLKQWKLEIGQSDSSSSNSDESGEDNDQVHVTNTFALLTQED